MFNDPISQAILVNGARTAVRNNRHLSTTIDQANANIDYANRVIAERNDEIARLREELNARNKEVQDFRLQAIVEMAGGEGQKAMFKAMKQAHPTSPMLADSGKRFKDGNVKHKAFLLYEEAFDRIIRDHQIANPETYRAN